MTFKNSKPYEGYYQDQRSSEFNRYVYYSQGKKIKTRIWNYPFIEENIIYETFFDNSSEIFKTKEGKIFKVVIQNKGDSKTVFTYDKDHNEISKAIIAHDSIVSGTYRMKYHDFKSLKSNVADYQVSKSIEGLDYKIVMNADEIYLKYSTKYNDNFNSDIQSDISFLMYRGAEVIFYDMVDDSIIATLNFNETNANGIFIEKYENGYNVHRLKNGQSVKSMISDYKNLREAILALNQL